MPYPREYSFTLPNHIIEDIADEVAKRVTARLQRQIQLLAVQPRQPVNEPEELTQPTFLRLKELTMRTGLSRSTIYNKMNEGNFPTSVSLGARSVGWRSTDIELWESNPTGYSHPL